VRRKNGAGKLFATAKTAGFPARQALVEWNGTVEDRLTLKFCAFTCL